MSYLPATKAKYEGVLVSNSKVETSPRSKLRISFPGAMTRLPFGTSYRTRPNASLPSNIGYQALPSPMPNVPSGSTGKRSGPSLPPAYVTFKRIGLFFGIARRGLTIQRFVTGRLSSAPAPVSCAIPAAALGSRTSTRGLGMSFRSDIVSVCRSWGCEGRQTVPSPSNRLLEISNRSVRSYSTPSPVAGLLIFCSLADGFEDCA